MEQHAKRQRLSSPSAVSGVNLASDAAFGAALTSALIEGRRDLAHAHRTLLARGLPVSLNQLQRFYYTQVNHEQLVPALIASDCLGLPRMALNRVQLVPARAAPTPS